MPRLRPTRVAFVHPGRRGQKRLASPHCAFYLVLISFIGLTFLVFLSIHCCVFLSKALSAPCGRYFFLDRYRVDLPVLPIWCGCLLFRSRLSIASALIVRRAGIRRAGARRRFHRRVPTLGIEWN